MLNLCSKSDAKMMENGWKMDAKLKPKPIKIMKKVGPENDAKKEAHRQRVGGYGASFFFRLKHLFFVS